MTIDTAHQTHPAAADEPPGDRPPRRRAVGIGAVVAGSMAAGFVASLALVAAPFVPDRPDTLIAAVLAGGALGWALLAVGSARLTALPQRWAIALAVFFAATSAVALLPDRSIAAIAGGWAWPPVLLALVVWTALQARRRMPARARRSLVYPLLAGLAVSSIGGGYESARETIDAARHPIPGQLISVGTHRLHLECTGSGTPTVILEPGLGESSRGMAWVAAGVAPDTRVCVYDRAGRGWSDPADGPQDAIQTAADLHTLLDRAGVPGPYVLAGHSFGGLYVLSYAAHYPNQVAGLVLLDSTAPAAASAPLVARPGSYDLVDRMTTVISAAADLGAAHLISDAYDSLPPPARDEARGSVSTARQVNSFLREFREGQAATRQAAALTDLDDKPLIVVTAGRGHDATWYAAQDKLTRLSTNARHRTVQHATHASLVLDRTDATAATNAILDVIQSIRTSQPLA